MSEAIGPTIHPTAVIGPGAVLIGRVTVEEDCYIAPGAVLRGDIEPILIRRGTNIQDGCIVHTEKGHPTEIGPDVSVGHGAVVHGAVVKERALIGMNAVILNGAVVGENALVGALSLVPDGGVVPPRSLAVGIPCKIVREDDAGVAAATHANTERYHRYTQEHRDGKWEAVVGPINDTR